MDRRLAAILAADGWQPSGDKQRLRTTAPADELETYPVSRCVNCSANADHKLVKVA